jgi:hypothetical protein
MGLVPLPVMLVITPAKKETEWYLLLALSSRKYFLEIKLKAMPNLID